MRRRSVLALGAGALALAGLKSDLFARSLAQDLDLVGRFRWHMDDPAFGGFSAIEMRDDGLGFIALSDRSSIVEGRFVRDAKGRIVDIEAGPPRALTGKDGTAARLDSEGLALAPGGRIYISEEDRHRVVVSRVPGQGLAPLAPVPGIRDLRRNQSWEALAVDAAGALYTLPEVPRDHGLAPVFRFSGGRWDQPFSLRRDEGWAAVGADFGPDGRFYLLERGFTRLGGFRTRIRTFTFTRAAASEGPIVLETPYRQYGNLEGLSVWLDNEGYLRFTMISDDNFLPFFLYTDIVEYRSRQPLAAPPPAR